MPTRESGATSIPATAPYVSLTGTSMAAPVVTGTIALMLEANRSPDAKPGQGAPALHRRNPDRDPTHRPGRRHAQREGRGAARRRPCAVTPLPSRIRRAGADTSCGAISACTAGRSPPLPTPGAKMWPGARPGPTRATPSSGAQPRTPVRHGPCVTAGAIAGQRHRVRGWGQPGRRGPRNCGTPPGPRANPRPLLWVHGRRSRWCPTIDGCGGAALSGSNRKSPFAARRRRPASSACGSMSPSPTAPDKLAEIGPARRIPRPLLDRFRS